MSWAVGNQFYKKPEISSSDYLYNLKGDLTEIEARLSLAKFLRTNPGIFFEMISGFQLLPIQELLIRAMLTRESGILIAARGFSKSFLISVLSLLVSILYPGVSIALISANFRGARRILEYSEKLVNGSRSDLLHQCFPENLKRQADLYRWKLPGNGSEIFALPLNPEGIRGVRANWVFLDETLNVDKDVQDSILRPFLTVKQNAVEEMIMREKEDELIKLGVMTHEDRISFPKNKFFMFSSASYQFQYLYELYTNYIENALNPKDKIDKYSPTFFACRFSYRVLEELPNQAFLDVTQINAAKADGGEQSDHFKKEYMALFPDISDGYFNIRKLHECSVKTGESPTLELKGNKSCEYVLAIDPAYSDSRVGDHFAMSVFLLAREEKKCFLVHSYTNIGGDLKSHYAYLSYLLTHFNIVFIIIDKSGNELLKGWNESTVAKERGLTVDFLDVDLEKDQLNELQEELVKARNQYNSVSKRIVYQQPFAALSQRKMNEHLKNQIEAKKVWFGSKLAIDEINTNKCKEIINAYNFKTKKDSEWLAEDFLEEQNQWVDETKAQTALIQVKASALGSLSYDLPQNIKRSTSENRPRKDSYTCLLMAVTAATHYFNIMSAEQRQLATTFSPIIIR